MRSVSHSLSQPMEREQAFEGYVRGGLAEAEVPLDEVEMAVIKAAWQMFGPAIAVLRDADLGSVADELEPDLSRPPAAA